MRSTATDAAKLYQAAGLGSLGENTFVGRDLPEDPDNVVIFVDTGTYEPDSPNLNYTSTTFQVIIRSNHGGYQKCWETVAKIRNLFHGYSYITDDATRYVYILTMSGPTDIGYDDNIRPRVSINFRALRTTRDILLHKTGAKQLITSFGDISVTLSP